MTNVYTVTNKLNGKRYVGITENIQQRWTDHRNFSKKKPTLLKQAMKKYGIDNFEFTVLEEGHDRFVAGMKEREYIKELNTQHPNGYNLTSGGDNLFHQSDVTKKRISETMMGRDVSGWIWKAANTARENNKNRTPEERSEIYGRYTGKFGPKHNKWIPSVLDDYDTAYRLYITEGKKQSELVEITGLHIRQVAKRLKIHGLRKNKKHE